MRVIRFKENRLIKSELIAGWELFGMMFKKGEEIVLIDDEDKLHWGKIAGFDDGGITLMKGRGRPRVNLDWDDIQFIAHDGFPVRPLFGADGKGSIEREDTGPTQKLVRGTIKGIGSLTDDRCPDCKKFTPFDDFREASDAKQEHETVLVCETCYSEKERYYVIRHPYLIESVPFNMLVNKGVENSISFRTATGWDDIDETVVMRSRDGAGALMWDVPSIYYFE